MHTFMPLCSGLLNVFVCVRAYMRACMGTASCQTLGEIDVSRIDAEDKCVY